MKKLFALIALSVSLSSAAAAWGTHQLKEIWVAPGPDPIVRLMTTDAQQQYFIFHLNSAGNAQLLELAKEAMANDFMIKIYADRNSIQVYYTGLKAPEVQDVTGHPLYTLAITK